MDGTQSDRSPALPSIRLSLSGRLTINEAETAWDVWSKTLSGCRELTLDTAGVEVIDTAGLQLLIALRHSAAKAGKAVRLAAPPSGALLTALVTMGFRTRDDNGPPANGGDGFWWGRS